MHQNDAPGPATTKNLFPRSLDRKMRGVFAVILVKIQNILKPNSSEIIGDYFHELANLPVIDAVLVILVGRRGVNIAKIKIFL